MTLKIGCLLEYNSNQEIPLILLLQLCKDKTQVILHEELSIEPSLPIKEYVDAYGNRYLRMIVPIGKLVINTSAIVETETYSQVDRTADYTLIQDLPDEVLLYLLPSRFCESDKLNNQAFAIVQDLETGYDMVEAIRQWVHNHIQYAYDYSTSSTSALDTLSAGIGVCRDLSHLAIAFCRSINIPARYVVGCVYQLYPMDLHAWFEVYLGNKWHTFDATQAVVTGGRVAIAHGRDAADVATATYFGDLELTNMNVFVEQIV